MSIEVAVVQSHQSSMQSYCFANAKAFEDAQRMAKLMSMATLVPKEYINNIPNCIIALEIAHRMQASPTAVMQNLYIVHGKPSWSSQFIIAAVNNCGRFKPLRFDMSGEGDKRQCIAWTIERCVDSPDNMHNLEAARAAKLPILESPAITIDIAKKEGWYNKNGSKWQTMPELMLRYRAASFFGKLYAPEILMGMQTQEEAEDISSTTRDVTLPNAGLKESFMNNDNLQSGSIDGMSENNKMDEILSRSKPEIVPVLEDIIENNTISSEQSLSAAEKKADEIISLLQKAESVKEVNAIMKEARNHLLAMDGNLKNMVWAAREEKIKVLGG